MTESLSGSRQVYWTVAIAVTIFAAIFSTVYSLTHSIYEVFPFLYFLPIILFVYFYPDKGVIFTVSMSVVYLILVYTFSSFNTRAHRGFHGMVCHFCNDRLCDVFACGRPQNRRKKIPGDLRELPGRYIHVRPFHIRDPRH